MSDAAIGDGEALLRRAEHRVELLSAFARGIVCVFDSKCRYRDVWATDERLLALPPQDLIGKTIVEVLGEEIGRRLMESTARVHETGVSAVLEYTLALPTGPRAFEAKVVRLANPDGDEPYRAVALIRDITEEKEKERRLNEAERLAALGVLAAGIGHEINNPLMIVQENARMIAQTLRELWYQGSADTFAARVQSMLGMVGSVLAAVSRMQKNVADLHLFRRDDTAKLTPVDPRIAVTRALELAGSHIEQRAVLDRQLDATPRVLADESKLSQVVLNLVLNAVQALPEGSARDQRVGVRTWTDPRGWAMLEVTDNGPGIPASELTRIFDPFFTTKREGMGLGLSVCQRIVTEYGGTISVDSEVGKGTAFRVALPPSLPVRADSPAQLQPSNPPHLGRLRLLVVDDEPDLLKILSSSLDQEYDVVTASGCDAALAIIAADPRFDAVLCDLMMPLGDGMSLYNRLETVAPSLQRRVIFMSGGAFTPVAARFLESISGKTLGKPFDLDSLRRVLSTL
jgi:signal transduction histidine kinase